MAQCRQWRGSESASFSSPARALLLDSINQAFAEPVVTAAPGGTGGGGAVLTAFGAEVLERYRRILDQANSLAADELAALARRARPEAGPKV